VGIFLFTTASRKAMRPTQPLIQLAPGALSLGESGRCLKLTTHLYLVPRSKNEWSCTFTPTIHLHGVVFSVKAQGQLYLLPMRIEAVGNRSKLRYSTVSRR